MPSSSPTLAIFDLDHTLISIDSDHGWNNFLVKKNLKDKEKFQAKSQKFYQNYLKGVLNMPEYLQFSLEFFRGKTPEEVRPLLEEYALSSKNSCSPVARQVVKWHQEQNHTCLIISATNYLVSGTIGKMLGFETILATQAELDGSGTYTGKPCGIQTFQSGKIEALEEYIRHNLALDDLVQVFEQAYFYTDSCNDIPLLEKVGKPRAVNPDELLLQKAQKMDWEVYWFYGPKQAVPGFIG